MSDDNACPQWASIIKEFLDEKNLYYLPSSLQPSLRTQWDNWMFLTLEYELNGEWFELDHEVMAKVQNFPKSLRQKEFEKTNLTL